MIALATGSVENGVSGLHVAGGEDLARRADYPLELLPSPHLDGTSPVGAFVRWETQRGFADARSVITGNPVNACGSDTQSDRLHGRGIPGQGTKRIAVLDPIFNMNRNRAIGLLGEMRRVGLPPSYRCNAGSS